MIFLSKNVETKLGIAPTWCTAPVAAVTFLHMTLDMSSNLTNENIMFIGGVEVIFGGPISSSSRKIIELLTINRRRITVTAAGCTCCATPELKILIRKNEKCNQTRCSSEKN
jgi:hypothetical protein